jgi:NADH:ubiquinone oxidoreductase subunit 4 (subunit M)
MLENLITIAYLVAAILFIFGLKKLTSPATARGGNQLSAIGMLIAVVATLFVAKILTPIEMIAGLALGGLIGGILAKRVEMTSMPELVAAFNGFGGLGLQMPRYFSMFSFALFAALGLPGLSGFVSEAMIFMGVFPVYRTVAIISALGIIIGAAYVLWMLQRVFLGPKNDKWDDLPDINTREMFTLVPIGIIVLVLGVYPMPVLNLMKVSLNNLIKVVAG